MSDLNLFDHRRLLPAGSFTRGAGLQATILGCLSTLSLIGAVVVGGLLIGVCAVSGPRLISAPEVEALHAALGETTPERLSDAIDEVGGETASIEMSAGGTIPLLLRDTYVGPGWLIAITKQFPALRQTVTAIPALSVVIVLLLFLHHFLDLGSRSAAERVAALSAKRIRGSLHRQALRLNLGDLDGKRQRQAQALFTGQTDTIATSVDGIVGHIVRDPFRVGLSLLILLFIDWRLTLLVILPVAATWAFVESERTRNIARQRLLESRAQRALRLLSEGLGKSRLIRGYGMEASELERFDGYLGKYAAERDTVSSSWRHNQRLSFFAAVVVGAIVAYLVGTKIAFDPDLTALEGAIFLLLLGVILTTASRAREVPQLIRRAKLASQRVNRYLDRIPDVSQAVGAKFLEPVEKAISFEAVTLNQGGRQLFENLELHLEAGSETAFVSLDPADARAAAFLLPRFLEPDSGRILFDGEDIAWGTLESLRAECCYVGGREPFFTGTIAENIAAGDNFNDGAIVEAAKKAHIHKFVVNLPEGYETVIGEHGQSLPAGQAFLLGLARAIVRDPAVLIIEEPDCSLDNDLKALIEDAYTRSLSSRTVVFLPRRLSTVRRVSKVVLFSKGRVEAIGTQAELVKHNELYRHWEYTSFSPFGRSIPGRSQFEEVVADYSNEPG